MAVGVPSGYNSKGDFFKGITSQMRANEKSSSPGYPGNQTSVAKKLSQLKDEEKSVLQFKPLPSMQVDASDVSAFVQKLDTEKSNNNINLVHSQKGRIDSQEDNESYDISTLGNDKVTFAGVNDQYYDNNNVPKMSLVPEKDTNTNNADYTSNVGDELISKERGIQYQEIGHGAGYVEPIKPINAEKDAASEVFMSSIYNDDQVYQPNLNEALNNEILNTSDKDLNETVTKAEDLKTAELQKSIAIVNQKAEEQRVSELAALKTLGLSDDNAPYVQDKEKGTYETDDMTVYRPAEIEFENEAKLKAQKIKDEIQAEKDLELSNRQLFQDSMMSAQDQVRDGVVEAGSLEVPITSTNTINEERLQASLKKQEEGFVDVIAGTTAKDMTATVREIAAERAEKERLSSNASTTPLGESQSQRLKDEQARERLSSNADTTPLGQNFGLKEEADRKIAKEKEEKRLHEQQINSETADNIAGESSFYNQQRGTGGKDRGKFRKLQAEKKAAKAKADRVADVVDNKTRDDNLIGHKSSKFKHQHAIARGSNDDPYHFTTLAYPPDAVNSQENGHFMLFYVNVQNKTKYEYKGLKNGQVVPVGDMVATPTFVDDGTGRRGGSGGGSKLITEYKPGAQAAGIAGPVEYQKQMIRNGGKGNIIYNNQTMLSKGRRSPGQNLNSKYPTTTRITDSVALYLPSGIGNSQSVSYGDFETGVAGYLTMSGLDVAKALQEDDFVGAATALFDKGGTLITDAIKKLALAGLETVGGGDGLQQNFDKIFGQTLNPYIEVAFQSSGMRTFDYTFKFAPKSKAETDEVKAIINLFRFHMLPEMKGTSHRYLTLPSTFDIHYMWQSGITAAKENSFYNKIATCVLTNVNVNYTPNGEVQSFGDGAPTQIEMGLSFKETEMMTKQHINEGF